jgi:hypothetical protein
MSDNEQALLAEAIETGTAAEKGTTDAHDPTPTDTRSPNTEEHDDGTETVHATAI